MGAVEVRGRLRTALPQEDRNDHVGRLIVPRAFLFLALASLSAFLTACSGLETLTPENLQSAREKWRATRPAYYRLVLEMSGDRVESGRFEVAVQGDEVVSLRRNGQVILPGRGQDYSMDGLFRMLIQELDLSGKPAMLGAPEGYSVYLMVRFDMEPGRLLRYRRTVGGAKNSIEIDVLSFDTARP